MKDQTKHSTKTEVYAGLIKREVMRSLDWTEEKYCEYQMEQGEIYLNTWITPSMPPDLKQCLLYSRIFWNWWKNHWMQRDLAFLGSASSRVRPELAAEIYKCLNDGAMLASDIHPNRVVMEESYMNVLHEIVKTETK